MKIAMARTIPCSYNPLETAMSKPFLAAISSTIIVGASLIAATTSPLANAATRPAVADPSGIGIHTGGAKVESNVSFFEKARKSRDWTSTPDGMEYSSCVHQIPAGARLDSINNTITLASGAVQKIKDCQYPRLVNPDAPSSPAPLHSAATPSVAPNSASPGPSPSTTTWLGAVGADPGTWMSYLSASYAVPFAPTESGATDYIFSSLENGSGNTILQPVVGYGTTNASGKPPKSTIGGNYLWMAPYYVWGNNVAVGNLYRVSALDTIAGLVTSGGCNGTGGDCTWTVSIQDENTGQLSEVTVGSDPSFLYAQGGVLESTTSNNCSQLFANGHGVFRNITLKNGSGNGISPDWYILDQVNQCNMHMDYSSTAVDILYSA
jgi:hypothetical protein